MIQYVAIFIVFYVLARVAVLLGSFIPPFGSDIFLLLAALVFTVGLSMYQNRKQTKDSVVDKFRFEVTPEKLCDGGPYMYTSNPEKQKFCSQFSDAQLSQYQCGPGFINRPLHTNLEPMSDCNWQNHLCDKGQLNFEQSVL